MLVMIFDKVEQEIKFTARAIDRRFVVVCQLWLTNMLILIFLVCYLFKNFHWSQLHFITVWEQPMRTSQRNLCFSILIINIGIVRIVFVMSSTLYVAKYYATWFGLNSFNLLFCVAVMLWCQGIDIRYNSVLEGIVRTWEMA